MFISYQICAYFNGVMVDCVNFKGYDDFSATHRAKKLFEIGQYDVVRLTKNGKTVQIFNRKKTKSSK